MEENAPVTPPSVTAKTDAQSGGILDKKQGDRSVEEAKSDNALAGTAAAPQPATPAPTPAPTDADDIARRDERKKPKATAKEADETVVVTNSAGAATTQTTTAESPRERARVASRSVQSLPSTKPAASKSAPAGAATEKDSLSETRTVGGHHFRRQGNVWVDAAYNSSRPAINVARGSEQYRALLADEPGLRTITQHLSGEVIVVWGNKAYRFY